MPGDQLVTFLTGAAVIRVFAIAERLELATPLQDGLRRATIVARGPKPAGALARRGLTRAIAVASPFTTADVLATLDRTARRRPRGDCRPLRRAQRADRVRARARAAPSSATSSSTSGSCRSTSRRSSRRSIRFSRVTCRSWRSPVRFSFAICSSSPGPATAAGRRPQHARPRRRRGSDLRRCLPRSGHRRCRRSSATKAGADAPLRIAAARARAENHANDQS